MNPLDTEERDSHGALNKSPWRYASGRDATVVEKQPSVAITIQKEHCYFSGINLSFLTHGNQSDCPQCINLHPSHTPGQLQHLELIIDPAVALWGRQGGPENPQWDAIQ